MLTMYQAGPGSTLFGKGGPVASTQSYACKPVDAREVDARPATFMVRTLAWSLNGHGIVRPRGCGGPPG